MSEERKAKAQKEKAERLAEALRENLRRRKTQRRDRKAIDEQEAPRAGDEPDNT